MTPATMVELKRIHAREIVDYLKEHEMITKKEIANEVNLSFATVSNICNSLKDQKYIKEESTDDSKTVGRTPRYISLVPNKLLSLCLNLTKFGKIRMAVIDYFANILFDKEFVYEENMKVEELVSFCANLYRKEVIVKYEEDDILGVGIAVPGIYEKKSRNIVSSEIQMFNNQPLKAMFEQVFGKSVYIDNDAKLCVASKQVKAGLESKQKDIVYVFADEGLGIGIITNGTIISGSGGYAPEICHIPIGNPKLTCHLCGGQGCVESDLRMMGYVEKYNLYSSKNISCFQEYYNLLKKGDEIAGEVLGENADICGKLLSILTNIFDPTTIYMGGETSDFFTMKLKQLATQIKSRLLVEGKNLPEIVIDVDSSITILKGASEMVLSQWLPEV